MLLRRKIILLFVLIGCGGSLGATAGYGWYLRSDRYRTKVEAGVEEFLGLPTDLGAIRTLSLESLAARAVRVWLPDRREQVFQCDHAVWSLVSPEPQRAFELELRDGALIVGTENWRREDYRTVLESGLGRDFAALQLRRAFLHNIDLAWRRADFDLAARSVNGSAIFHDDGTGQLSVSAWWLNDYRVPTPIHIDARFRTGNGLVVEEVAMDVPELPLTALRLDKVLGSSITQGDFSGRVVYQERDGQRRVRLAGNVTNLLLAELTTRLATGPIAGLLTLDIDEAQIVNETIERVRFRGHLEGFLLAPVARFLTLGEFPGALNLTVHQCAFADGRIEFLSLSGQAAGVSTQALTTLVGRGRITGRLRVVLESLQVVSNEIRGGELTVEVTPLADTPGTIDSVLLRAMVTRLFGLELPNVLPEKVEYTNFGFRCRLDRARLYLTGLHGPENKTILTVKIFGRRIPLVRQPEQPFDVSAWLALIHDQLEAFQTPPIRDLWPDVSEPKTGG